MGPVVIRALHISRLPRNAFPRNDHNILSQENHVSNGLELNGLLGVHGPQTSKCVANGLLSYRGPVNWNIILQAQINPETPEAAIANI